VWKLILAHKLLALAIVSTPVAIAVARRRRASPPLVGADQLPGGHTVQYTGDSPRAGVNDELPTLMNLIDNPDNSQLRINAIRTSDPGVNKGSAQGGGPDSKVRGQYGAGAARDNAGLPVRSVNVRPAPVGTVVTRPPPPSPAVPRSSSPTRVGVPQPRPLLPSRPPLHIPASPSVNRGSFK